MTIATNSNALHEGLNPNTMYYLALYFFVVLVRFFKLKKDQTNNANFDYKKIFHVGLELVYTASGLVVLLLSDLSEYAAFIVIGYLIFFIVSSQIETMEDKFSARTVFITNVIILISVCSVTYWYFEYVHPRSQAAQQSHHTHYRVLIPYTDMAMRDHVGTTFGDREFVYIYDLDADTASAAKNAVLKRFHDYVKPFDLKKRMATPEDLMIRDEQIVVQGIQAP